jgi:hypothetical protein
LQLASHLDGLSAIAGLAHHLPTRLLLQHTSDTSAKNFMVVGNQDAKISHSISC